MSRLDKLAGLKAAKTAKLDVLSSDAVGAFAASIDKEFGALNVLANVAGYVHQGTVLECSEKDWDFSFDLNVKSMHRTIKAFLPAMLKNGGGSIINMSSGVSSIKGLPNRYAYGATKAAVIGLTKAVAADFITKGIRCNAICPGTIVSPSFEERVQAVAKQTGTPLDQVRKNFIARQPMARLGYGRGSRRACCFPCLGRVRATSPASRTWSMAAWRFRSSPAHRRWARPYVGLAFRRAKAG